MSDVLAGREAHRTELRLVKSKPQGAHRVHLEAFEHARLVPDQPLDVGAQRVGQRLRERREQNAAVRHRARQVNGAMKSDDRLASARGARHARWPLNSLRVTS